MDSNQLAKIVRQAPKGLGNFILDREPDLEIEGYLLRWHLTNTRKSASGGALMLHYFMAPDLPVLHNHPWDFDSLILTGGYREISTTIAISYKTALYDRPFLDPYYPPPHVLHRQYRLYRKNYTPGMINSCVGGSSFHFIAEIEPNTWSLVSTSPRQREWGFLPRRDKEFEDPYKIGVFMPLEHEFVWHSDYTPKEGFDRPEVRLKGERS